MKRRTFLKTGSAAIGASAISAYWSTVEASVHRNRERPVPLRAYRDGIELSIIGFGGIVVCGQEQSAANDEVARSWDRGVNYYDVAPSYWEGEAERKLGIGLKPFRNKAFLACKTEQRDAKGAMEELEISLERMGTDYFDLYQFHAVTKMEDVERIFAPGGAMEAFVKARDQGKIRYIGFSAHSEAAGLALLDGFAFDSILYPVNYVCWAEGSFGPEVVARAKQQGAAILALKSLAYTPWDKDAERTHPKCWYRPIDDIDRARMALRFTLSQGATAAIPPGDQKIYNLALDLACDLAPMDVAEQQQLLQSASGLDPLFNVSA